MLSLNGEKVLLLSYKIAKRSWCWWHGVLDVLIVESASGLLLLGYVPTNRKDINVVCVDE